MQGNIEFVPAGQTGQGLLHRTALVSVALGGCNFVAFRFKRLTDGATVASAQVIVAVRSILLRGFDRQCALKVGSVLKELGVRFVEAVVVEKIEKTESGRLRVFLKGTGAGATMSEELEVDTVLYATGRSADTRGLSASITCADLSHRENS